MLGHQQGEVGILGLQGGILIAVAVDGDDAVGVLVDHGATGVHAEGADTVAVLLGDVDDLGLVQLVGDVGENVSGQLHTDAQVHTVTLGGDLQLLAHTLHPLGADTAHGDNALAAGIGSIGAVDLVAVLQLLHGVHRGIEEEVHLLLQLVVQVLQHHIVDVGAQMTDGSVQQVQVVLDALPLELGACGGVELGALAAVGHIDIIHITHQVQGLLLADVFEQGAAEVVGDVVLAVGKCACAAETAHDGAALAADAGLDLVAVNGAVALVQGVTGLKNSNLHILIQLHQLVGGKDTAGACADNNYIIVHG